MSDMSDSSGDRWKGRFGCARATLREAFRHGFGRVDRLEPALAGALGQVLAHPGSLVRAVVAYLIALEMGLVEDAARALGLGIEYLHSASLLFDDLPAMDDARMRRGEPCVHVRFGEGAALLAALALVNRGYALLWRGMQGAPRLRRAEAGRYVESCLGTAGLVGGQAHDLRGWGATQEAADVTEVAMRKTVPMLALPVVLPAILGKGTAREIQLLEKLCQLRGLAYQAADDLKDVFGSDEGSGKTTGRDEACGRPNLVRAEGAGAVLARFRRLDRLARRIEQRLPGDPRRWEALSLFRVEAPGTGTAAECEFLTAAV